MTPFGPLSNDGHFSFFCVAMLDLPRPQQFDISLEMKIGEFQKQCRKKLNVCMWLHDSSIDFTDLQTTVDDYVQRELRKNEHNGAYVRSDMMFYCKRSKSTKQSEYQKVTASSMDAVFSGSWSSHCRAQGNRAGDHDAFQVLLIVYVAHASSSLQRMHRATKARIASASRAVRAFVADNDIPGRVGEISQEYWTITHARQPTDTPVSVPTNRTFLQMQALDALRCENDPQHNPIGSNSGENDFRPIRIRGIGDGVTTLQISVSDLRLALGLPNHDLLATGIFNSPPDAIGVPDDQEDIDHMDQDDAAYDSETI